MINRNVLSVALSVFGLLMVVAQIGCQRAAAPTNLAEARAAASPTPEKIDTAAIEAELIRLEREWVDAIKSGNADAAKRVMSDDIVVINPDGSASSKAAEIQAIQDKLVTMDSWEIVDPKVTVLDAKNAFVTGQGVIKNGKSKAPGSKRTIDISGEYRFLDVYSRRDGAWQAVASQTTLISKDE